MFVMNESIKLIARPSKDQSEFELGYEDKEIFVIIAILTVEDGVPTLVIP